MLFRSRRVAFSCLWAVLGALLFVKSSQPSMRNQSLTEFNTFQFSVIMMVFAGGNMINISVALFVCGSVWTSVGKRRNKAPTMTSPIINGDEGSHSENSASRWGNNATMVPSAGVIKPSAAGDDGS